MPRAHRATPGVAYLPLTDAGAHREIGLVWLRDRAVSPVAERFRRVRPVPRWS